MAITARELATTITAYVHDETVATMRNRKLLAILNDRGQITFGHGGKNFQWQVQYRQHDLAAYSDGMPLNFSPQNLWVDALLDWRGYTMTDSIGMKEKLENKGDEALVEVIGGMTKRMTTNARQRLGEELYVDGYATGNNTRYHGLESFLHGVAAGAGSKIATNTGSYAGQSNVLQSKGGAWTPNIGAWPTGKGDSQVDFWTPLLVDYSNTGFSGLTQFRQNCLECLPYGLTKAKKNQEKDGAIDLIMLTDDMYLDFRNAQEDKTRLVIERGGSSGLYKLGFPDVLNLDGIDVTYEYGVPIDSSTSLGFGYGLAMGVIELKSLQDELIHPVVPFFDINTLADKFALTIFGNLEFEQLRGFVKWAPYT